MHAKNRAGSLNKKMNYALLKTKKQKLIVTEN